jgi:hypothetical protein
MLKTADYLDVLQSYEGWSVTELCETLRADGANLPE